MKMESMSGSGMKGMGSMSDNMMEMQGAKSMSRGMMMMGKMKSMGTMFDWEREAISCTPEYYKWSQWFFNQLYKHKMAYRSGGRVDWCPNCNTTLAREQVWGEDKVCERCGTPVIKKKLEQWFFKTTDYAEELLLFTKIDWPRQKGVYFYRRKTRF